MTGVNEDFLRARVRLGRASVREHVETEVWLLDDAG